MQNMTKEHHNQDIIVSVNEVEGRTSSKDVTCCAFGFCSKRNINPDDCKCDFRTLKKDKQSILERINLEKAAIRKMIEDMPNKNSFKMAMLRKQEPPIDKVLKESIMDKFMGIYKMKEILESDFQVPNEYKNNIMLLRREIILGIYKG